MDSSGKTKRSMWHRALSLDEAISTRVASMHKESMTHAMVTFTRLGDASSWVALAFVLLAIGEPTRRYFSLLVVSSILATIATQVVKHLCRRQRPRLSTEEFEDHRPDEYSFPSGHTTTAFAVGAAMLGEGAFLGSLLLTAAGLIGFSRVYLRAHYPLDVIAGSFLGILIGLLTRFLIL
ncbi:MAG: phosphoesterase [Deltaproteobacteria bacterium]|nr:phosphoesterase [Deltaproteobacteria bacterium]MBU52883.1 phosphoesterase [Deltaproteobacteria bacterium]|tara:strand:- start:24076 stop:24612 length:537 start_codon:yes stop_codon:yes gene_type:complete